MGRVSVEKQTVTWLQRINLIAVAIINFTLKHIKQFKPFMLKCSGGQDRTSFAAALYLIYKDGWAAMPAARAQFARFPYLHFPKRHQRWLKAFLDFALADSGGLPLEQWIAGRYTPEALKAWLDTHGLDDGYAAIFTAPTRSPNQW